MRNLITLFLCATSILTSCNRDDVDVYAVFSVYNRTEYDVKIVSNIKSELYVSEQIFELGPGDIMDVSRFEYVSKYVMSGICRNSDAYFHLYRETEEGEYVLTKEWKYEDRNSKERNVFNPIFSSEHLLTDTDDLLEWNIIFTILPEDLEIPAEAHEVCSSL